MDGETGWLIEPREPAPLAEKMTWLLDNPDQAKEMGAAGRKRVLEHFDIRNVVEHQVKIYKRLIAEKRLHEKTRDL